MDANGDPVPGVAIGWVDARPAARGDASRRKIHELAWADKRGHYAINHLPPGPCRMVAGIPHFPHPTGAYEPWTPATPVLHLRQGATVQAPRLRLPVDPRILGTLEVIVRDYRGDAVQGASVYVSHRMEPWGKPRDKSTDRRGRIRLTGVVPGPVSVRVNGRPRHADGNVSSWMPPGGRRTFRVRLADAPANLRNRQEVLVRCRDDRGRPLRGCRVHVYGFDTKDTSTTRITGAGGIARLSGHVREEWRPMLSGSAWKLGYASTQFRVDLPDAGRAGRVDVEVRRKVEVGFDVVDALNGAPVPRTGLAYVGEKGDQEGTRNSTGWIGPDPPDLPRVLLLPSLGLPMGRATVRIDAPGYLPAVLHLRVRPRKGSRIVRVRLHPTVVG